MSDIQSDIDPTETPLEAQSVEVQPVDAVQPEPVETATTPTQVLTPATTAVAGDIIALPDTSAPVAEVADPAPPPTPLTPEQIAAKEAEKAIRDEERRKKEEERKQRDEAYDELTKIKELDQEIEFLIQQRVKGGLRGEYKGLRLFLPASQFGMRKSVSEDELNAAVGSVIKVKIHELQADETGYKSAVVTRKELISSEFWDGIAEGSVFEGVVTSVTTFGAFVNIGGIEGLVHVSKLSKARVDSPADVVKKGDKIKVTVTGVDKEKKKLSLSHKEHEEDPWVKSGVNFTVGSRIKGTVRRITHFGAYVQVQPKIEGLVRISEISWGIRIKSPADALAEGQEIEVEVLSFEPDKQQLSLGYKQTLINPWDTMAESMPLGTEVSGVVQQISTQGAVIRVNNVIDGFMPRSKMAMSKDSNAPFALEETVVCYVVDVKPETFSLILGMKSDDGNMIEDARHHQTERPERAPYTGSHNQGGDQDARDGRGGRGGREVRGGREDRGNREGKGRRDESRHRDSRDGGGGFTPPPEANVTLGDLLKDIDKTNLMNK